MGEATGAPRSKYPCTAWSGLARGVVGESGRGGSSSWLKVLRLFSESMERTDEVRKRLKSRGGTVDTVLEEEAN
jgi:ABC-type microcin C transport system duplicated ATPase subunit YejF